MPMHHGNSRIKIESIRHIDQFQEIISIIEYIEFEERQDKSMYTIQGSLYTDILCSKLLSNL